jgi:hypothetical protein
MLSSILGTVTALAVISASTLLAHEHVIDGQAVVELFATLLGGAGGGAIAIVAHRNARRAK